MEYNRFLCKIFGHQAPLMNKEHDMLCDWSCERCDYHHNGVARRNYLLGFAGEDLRCGDYVVIGECGKIYKAKQSETNS